MQSLLLAGANVDFEDINGVTPVHAAVPGSGCRDLLEHHTAILAIVTEDPAALVSAAVAYCAILASSAKPLPSKVLFLDVHYFDPTFAWAPDQAQKMVFTWARNVFIVQLATITDLFVELPDDCAGDVLEYLETTMSHSEFLHNSTHCISLEANMWVRAIVAAAVAVSSFVSSVKNVCYVCHSKYLLSTAPFDILTGALRWRQRRSWRALLKWAT